MSLERSFFDDPALEKFLDQLAQLTEYDFRNYSRASMKRRLNRVLSQEQMPSLDAAIKEIEADWRVARRMIESLSIPTTSMFRDPQVFQLLRSKVLPELADLPLLRIWNAGCSTGEEVYSVAIMLEEEGFANRYRIYATDMNETLLAKAKAGIYSVRFMKEYTANYLASGGSSDFSSYYASDYGKAIFHERMKRNIVFARHSLVTDASFNEFGLIFCRNVLIYFNDLLRRNVYMLLDTSLAEDGYLILGEKESLSISPLAATYRQIERPIRVFRKGKNETTKTTSE